MLWLVALALVGQPPLRDVVVDACRASIKIPSAHVETRVLRERIPPGCRISTADPPPMLQGSTTTTMRLRGADGNGRVCSGVASVRVVVRAEVWQVERALRAGEPLSDSAVRRTREVRADQRPWLAALDGLVADRALAAGTIVDERQVRADGPGVGEAVRVVMRAGGLEVSRVGTITRCSSGRVCALTGGRVVAGRLVGGELQAEAP